MTVHILKRQQEIAAPVTDVFEFFADARNLQSLTPPWLNFRILTPGRIPMHAGAVIQYALRVHRIPVHWTTVIPVWNPPHEFVDVQIRGPYLLWHHRHTFEAAGSVTRMTDEVHYKLPWGPLGTLAHALMVRRDLACIFDFRATAITQFFSTRPETA